MNDDHRRQEDRPFWGWEAILALAIIAILGGAIFEALWSDGVQEGRRQMTVEQTRMRAETVQASAMESELRSLPLQDAERIMAEAKQRIDRKSTKETVIRRRRPRARKVVDRPTTDTDEKGEEDTDENN